MAGVPPVGRRRGIARRRGHRRGCAYRGARAGRAGPATGSGVRDRHELPRPRRRDRPGGAGHARDLHQVPDLPHGPLADVVLPSEFVDWEVELVVVIGARAHHVTSSGAWDHVAGVTVGQDLSERVVQISGGGQFSLGKSFPGFGPTGPWLVTPDELHDPDDLELSCSVDGREVQKSRTSQMVFGVPELIARLSAVLPLLPGDLIFTGTPAGIGATRQPPQFLRPGQVLSSYLEGAGTIANRLIAPPRNRQQ